MSPSSQRRRDQGALTSLGVPALRTYLLLGMLVVMLVTVCEEPASSLNSVDAPNTAEEQHAALVTALNEAQTQTDWPRAEVVAATFSRIDPKDSEDIARLRSVRARRAVYDELLSIQELLNAGAWRTCQGRLQILLGHSLHDDDHAFAKALMDRVGAEHHKALGVPLLTPGVAP